MFCYTNMNQHGIWYRCETKPKAISTLHRKKEPASVVRGLQQRMVRRGKAMVQAWWDCLRRWTGCCCLRCRNKESTLDPRSRDLRAEMNKDPNDNGKCWSFWKRCAFETITTLESAFLQLYLWYMWRQQRDYNNFILLWSEWVSVIGYLHIFQDLGIVSQVP